MSCLQSVKDTKFESNSQHADTDSVIENAVCSPSKILSLKAIHNAGSYYTTSISAVCSPSKILSLKAIHNTAQKILNSRMAVCSPSKILSLKAIHNTSGI